MRVSLFFFAAGGSEDDADRYGLLLDCARLADDSDVSAIWTPERHFADFGGLYPNPSLTSAAIAAVTTRVGIRAGSVALPLHDPLRVAEEWAVVDNLSHGRAGVSFAAGWHRRDFVLRPANYASRSRDLYETIGQVRRLWQGQSLTVAGVDGQPVSVKVFPRPVQRDLPIWITSGGSAASVQAAGRAGYGLLTHLVGQPRQQLTGSVDHYRRALPSGRGNVVLMLHAFVCDTPADLDALVLPSLKIYLKSSMELEAADDPLIGEEDGVTAEEESIVLEHAAGRHLDNALIGSVDEIRRRMVDYAAAGVDEIACLVDFGVDRERTLESVRRLCELASAATTAGIG